MKPGVSRIGIYILSLLLLIFVFFSLIIIAGNLFPKLSDITPDTHDHTTKVYDSTIRYNIYPGSEPTILLLHGFGGDIDGWKKIQENIKYKTIAVDMIGFGGSERPHLAYNLDTHHKYLIGFMDKLNIKSAVLVGGSMGGSVAAWTTSKSSNRVKGLIMIALLHTQGRYRQIGHLIGYTALELQIALHGLLLTIHCFTGSTQ